MGLERVDDDIVTPRRDRRVGLWVALGLFLLTVVFVGPAREMALEDDWAYARTVRHLLETGEYHLDDWLSANMPFQAWWGALFARTMGYSHTALRLSTILLAMVGLIALYCLAREHGMDDCGAGLLALGLLSSPLFLRFSFSFMTDVPYTSLLILALLFYTRALKRQSVPLMWAASVAASACILTRQFAMALVAAGFALWLMTPDRRRSAALYVTGLLMPAAAAVWQLHAGALAPNWAAQAAAKCQVQYIRDVPTFLAETLWRPSVVLHYLALFSLPFVFVPLLMPGTKRFVRLAAALGLIASGAAMIVAGVAPATADASHGVAVCSLLIASGVAAMTAGIAFARCPSAAPPGQGNVAVHRPAWAPSVLLVVLAVYMVWGIHRGHRVMGTWFMPYLDWCFGGLRRMDVLPRAILTAITAAGGFSIGRLVVLRYAAGGWTSLPPYERFLDLCTFFLLLMRLVFYQIGDEYLLELLPFILLVAGRHLGPSLCRHRKGLTAMCLACLVVAALWTRGIMAEKEALWTAAESLRLSGVEPAQVQAAWEWNCYHGAFAEYVAERGDRPEASFPDFVRRFLPGRAAHARFLVAPERRLAASTGTRQVLSVPYYDATFRLQHAYVLQVGRGGKAAAEHEQTR